MMTSGQDVIPLLTTELLTEYTSQLYEPEPANYKAAIQERNGQWRKDTGLETRTMRGIPPCSRLTKVLCTTHTVQAVDRIHAR